MIVTDILGLAIEVANCTYCNLYTKFEESDRTFMEILDAGVENVHIT
jgi:hypothetical protein